MSKTDDLAVILEALRHAVEYHEWCDGGERVRCGVCNQNHYTCQDSGVCDGCTKREAAIQALNGWV
jgi:hypothetical protein